MSDEVPGWGVRLQTEVEQLQGSFASHAKENRDTHEKLYLRTERPPWMVVWVFGIMGSLLGGLIIWAVTHS